MKVSETQAKVLEWAGYSVGGVLQFTALLWFAEWFTGAPLDGWFAQLGYRLIFYFSAGVIGLIIVDKYLKSIVGSLYALRDFPSRYTEKVTPREVEL